MNVLDIDLDNIRQPEEEELTENVVAEGGEYATESIPGAPVGLVKESVTAKDASKMAAQSARVKVSPEAGGGNGAKQAKQEVKASAQG